MIKWTDRKFTFGYTYDHLPLFIERLKTTAPRLEEMVINLSENKLTEKPGGKWSIKEHIGHLNDLEELHDGRIDDFRNKLQVLRAADMANKKTEEMHHNISSINVLLKNFRESRNHFLNRIAETDSEILKFKSLHPRLNELISIPDMLFFIGEHDLQHLSLIANFNKKV